jgi:biotin carboxyl carrier protein
MPMKRYRITLDDRTFDVQVLDDPRQGRVRVQVDGETLTVDVETLAAGPEEREAVSPDAIAPPVARELARPAAPPDGLVTAPLPGVIKSIAVRPGQEVASGDPLLVIEAMKMDNVIRAARRGTVGTIHVAEGHHVAHGDALLTFAD